MTHEEWLQIGIENKWCMEPVCYTHIGPQLTDDESAEFEEGFDPCVLIVRLSPEVW